uniref:SHSP domain-containing protein n=1 Tax=Monopterus albus TaxID=43700 RepID=A0A3Q3IN42_MONAL
QSERRMEWKGPFSTRHTRGGLWFPLRKWWHLSQDVGLPPFLEPGNPVWMNVNWLQRSLAAFSWPLYIPAPLFVPYICGSMHHPSQKISKEQYKWRVNLDVAHFAPAEISLSVRDGFLEIAGKHEERPDEHGFIARCFTRKYRLPAETDASKISSTLTVDGILTVEASVPEASVPAAIIIPIKVIKTGRFLVSDIGRYAYLLPCQVLRKSILLTVNGSLQPAASLFSLA